MISINNKDDSLQPVLFNLPTVKSKHKFEYQELAEQLEPIYGKGIWVIFTKPKFTEYEVKRAHKIAQERGILKLSYLIGIIKRNTQNLH